MKFVTISLLMAGIALARPLVAAEKFTVPFEKFTLPNGLDVIFHQDKSDPIVAVAIQYHVGSNREKPGKTGFAHLFEHMMFQESENVPQDQFFTKIQNAGGTLNGGTNKDGTVYYEVVPNNALEMVLWMESDRMGYLINTVTPSAFVNQQNVVQNEKRQNYDNRPYGHAGYVMDKNFYPTGHPYSWQTIGEMADLTNATIKDVKEFHAMYYVPNNATLVIAGDFNPAEAKRLVEKYFGEIPGGKKVTDLSPVPVTLTATKKLFHEDNLATSPQLTMAWSTPQQYTADSYALSLLSSLLSDGKKAPMYRVLVKEKQLTTQVRVNNMAQELTGRFQVSVNATPGVSLAEVEKAVFEAYDLFEKEGITDNDLERIKAGMETMIYNQLGSVLNKSFQLARYNEYAGDPGFIAKDFASIMAVTKEDVKRVYEKYIKGKHYVATSFVPKGQSALVAAQSVRADIVEEKITDAVEVKLNAGATEEPVKKSPSKFDRSKEPPLGPDPAVNTPEIWQGEFPNGIKTYGITNSELPLIQFNLSMYGGHLLDPKGKEGLASLVAGMMTEGTKNRTPEELEETIDLLGSRISFNAGTENITVSVNTLSRNFEKTMALVEEMILEPRWDEEQFNILKRRVINNLRRQAADPSYLASSSFRKLVYGDNHILSTDVAGTVESVNNISLEDLKKYYASSFSPSQAQIRIVGDVDASGLKKASSGLINRWKAFEVKVPSVTSPEPPVTSKVYVYDIPGAKQSNIQIGGPSISMESPDFFPATVVNYKLGGSFNGNLNLILREEKGYTYGARSYFTGGRNYGLFSASASVRSSATLESVSIFREEMEKYNKSISASDLQFTKNALIRSAAREFETADAKLSMLSEIGFFNKPANYRATEQNFIRSLTPERHVELTRKLISPDKMYYLVAGDAETQLPELEKLGLGKPVLLNPKK